MNDQPELTAIGPEDADNLINNSTSRSVKSDNWWVITGTHVRLPEDLPASRPVGTNHLLVAAETISLGISGATHIVLTQWSDVIVMGKDFKRYNGCDFQREKAVLDHTEERFTFTFFYETLENIPLRDRTTGSWPQWELAIVFPKDVGNRLTFDESQLSYIEVVLKLRRTPRTVEVITRFAYPRPFTPDSVIVRLLLTAQYLIDERRPDDAKHILDLLDRLLALHNGAWQELVPLILGTRELLQPQLPGSNLVPELSPSVYSGVAKSYGPALRAFADRFKVFMDHRADIQQRRQAAARILSKEADIIRFQKLVTDQLRQNFDEASVNVRKAQESMTSQEVRVRGAEQKFQAGLGSWRAEQQRKAAMAIAGAAFSFVAAVASMFAGNPKGAQGAAAAAEAAAKAGSTFKKIVELMRKVAKIVKLVTKIAKMSMKIVAAVGRISNAKEFADQMADMRREAESGLGDAPSASAYWDQLWVEVETALAPAISAKVGGAVEYLKELKVMIIYGRALTAAQATIPPIVQELARAALLAELATQQHDAVAREVEALKAGQAAPEMTAIALWLDHRSVQRTILSALQDFDAAHRYWALENTAPRRDLSRSFTEVASDLLAIGDIALRSQQALERFRPRPQDFERENFIVPDTTVADFLRDGRFTIRFMPDFGPFEGDGDVGRVRVSEIFVWVDWNKNKRPEGGRMEFTIRTNGEYYDQRVESGTLQPFRFTMNPVNFTFLYNVADNAIRRRARIAQNFRHYYPDPTLFTEWQISLPGYGGAEALQDGHDTVETEALKRIDLEDLQGAVSSIRLEFSGEFIKDAKRLI